MGLVLALLGLLRSLPSVSLGRPVPTELWLRPSSSDATNAATLFLQGCTCSVAFLRICIIYIVGFPHESIGITVASVCFCGISGKFSFWEIKILVYF